MRQKLAIRTFEALIHNSLSETNDQTDQSRAYQIQCRGKAAHHEAGPSIIMRLLEPAL